MVIIKKKNKFTIPPLYDTSVFWDGGTFAQTGQAMKFGDIKTPTWDTQMGGQGMGVSAGNTSGIASSISKTPFGSADVSGVLGVAQGVMQLGSQIGNNLSTAGIGSEVKGTNDISKGDILSTNTNIDSKQTDTAGQSLSGAMTGAQAGMAFGPWGAAIGGVAGGLAGGLSSIFGNSAKRDVASNAKDNWINNLEAKDRQFNQEDTRSSMANFSSQGGSLKYSDGGRVEQPLTEFNSGGTHEENPQGGVQQGVGSNGKPNLVEEGETKHDDYIFSDRLKVTEKLTRDFKLPQGLNGKTFADASKVLSKESKERPNDPISINGAKAQLAKLTAAQEGLKSKMEQSSQQTQQQNIPIQQEQQNPQANIMAQGQQQMADGGQIPSEQSPQQDPSQQGGNQQQAQQIVQDIMQMIQQGQQPEQIVAQLVKAGIPQQQATQLVQQVEQQSQQQGSQQEQGQSQQSMEQPSQQQVPQQMAFGGYKPKKTLVADTKMRAVIQQIQIMMQQGSSQEDVETQLEKTGMSADQAQQLVMTAMQQIKGQQPQRQMQQQPSQGQMQGILQDNSQMAFGGSLYADGGDLGKTQESFWGIKNNKYTKEFKDSVNQLYNDPTRSEKAVQDLKGVGYVNNKEDLLKYSNDYIVGPVHDYMIQNVPKPRLDYGGDYPDRTHGGRLTNIKLSEVRKARETNPNAYIGYEAGAPTGTTFSHGGNIFAGPQDGSNYIKFRPGTNMDDIGQIQKDNPSFHDKMQLEGAFNDYKNSAPDMNSAISKYEFPTNIQNSNLNMDDYLRYTPAITNAITGINDMMQTPEIVKYGRINPERITAHQDYQPIDTEWMNNKMNANYAGTRDQMINNSGGNRATAMASLSNINSQEQNAVGEAYLRAGDTNYQRKIQANQFNAGIEQQNISAQNQAQQTNLQLAMQEADSNARNRAAQRNASRNAIISGANTIGDIGRENFNANTIKSTTGYKYNDDGTVNKDIKIGTIYNRRDGKKEIYDGKDWILQK